MDIVKGYNVKFEKLDTSRKRGASKYKKATSYPKSTNSSISERSLSNSQLVLDPMGENANPINDNQEPSIEIKL